MKTGVELLIQVNKDQLLLHYVIFTELTTLSLIQMCVMLAKEGKAVCSVSLPEFIDPGICCLAARNILVEVSKNYTGEE